MTKMKEAAVGNKKRSIDQLNEEGDFTHVNVKIVNDGESTTAIDIEKVACEEKSESVVCTYFNLHYMFHARMNCNYYIIY